MYGLKANFYPAAEQKNGYVGKADVTIGNGWRLNNISVFQKEDGGLNVQFGRFGKDDAYSFVVPKTSDAYAAIVGVIEPAMNAENHFAFTQGENLKAKDVAVVGGLVDEPYADGRFTVSLGDFVALNGISTRVVEYADGGKDKSFVAVDLPVVRDHETGEVKMYAAKDGREVADLQYEGLTMHWEKDGKQEELNWNYLVSDKVRAKRNELLKEKEQGLDAQIEAANSQKVAPAAPAKEQEPTR